MPNSHQHIGGQALIEGVMILAPEKYSMSVRKPDGSIKTKVTKLPKQNKGWKTWPVARGFFNLARMLVLGMKALVWSANESAETKEEQISRKEATFTVVLSLFLAIGIFVVLPYFLTVWLGYHEESKPVMFNLIDGVIRIAFFVLYVWAISFLSDVRRMFQYHGAEHMSIHCYEKGKPLTVQNVRKFSPIHPRCGTAFILIVLIVAIMVFSLVPSIYLFFFPNFMAWDAWIRKPLLIVTRIALIPVIAGLSYEILKASDRRPNNIILKLFSLPGLWLQRITTRKPENDQIEVAIASVMAVAPKKKPSPGKHPAKRGSKKSKSRKRKR